MNTHWYLFTCE